MRKFRIAKLWREWLSEFEETITTVVPWSFSPMQERSCSSEMNRGQNSPLAKFFSEMTSEMSASCPKE
jgi:hypothetical protein